MRKYFIAFALVLFIVCLTSCDVMLGGKNAFGVDKTLITEAVKSTTLKEEEKPKAEEVTNRTTVSGKKTTLTKFTDENDKELFSVGKTETNESEKGTNVISIGKKDGEDVTIELPDSKVDLSKVESVLPEKNIDDVVTALEGKGKDQILEELKKEVTDPETKKAAKGTATVIQAVLEQAQSGMGESSNKDVKETIDKIVENLEKITSGNDEDEKKITQGDVVILQALSNVVYSSTDDILDLLDSYNKDSSSEKPEEGNKEEEQKEAMKAIMDKANDSAMGLVNVVNKASSSSPIFSDVDISSLISSLTGSSENK